MGGEEDRLVPVYDPQTAPVYRIVTATIVNCPRTPSP